MTTMLRPGRIDKITFDEPVADSQAELLAFAQVE